MPFADANTPTSAFGGSGGDAPNGGMGGPTSYSAPGNGTVPGGGGGGGGGTGGVTGGTGGNGQINVEYFP